MMFWRNPILAPPSWLSLLFAILALACRAEEDHTKGGLYDCMSMWYENVAWDCLLTNDAPFEPSRSSLKAMVLIIYGRTHRGENVLNQLQMAHQMAISIECHEDISQCVLQPSVCEECRSLSIGLKTLFMLNGQMHDYYRNPELREQLQLLADTGKLSPENSRISMGVEGSSPAQMTFTHLKFQLLKISDTICLIAELGLRSEWSVAALEAEISLMEKHCSNLYTKSSGSGSQLVSPHMGYGILHCYINYLLHLLFMPDLWQYLNGDIAPETELSAFKCMAFAKASLRTFNHLAENIQPNTYAWYIRGLGSYYAEQSASTLIRGATGLEGEKEDQEIRSLVERTLGIFSTLSDRSIFSTRGAFILEYRCMPQPPKRYSPTISI
jgi:hypothetical protein